MPRRNFLLVLAYDGTDFFGWQRLPGSTGSRTVQATVEHTLSAVLGEQVEVTGAGRTDRGVHAEGQAASFHSRTPLAPDAIAAALNREFPPDLSCVSCREVDPRFHARFRARSKVYRYRLHESPAPDPALRGTSLHVPGPLDLEAVRRAGAILQGERDFAFMSNEKEKDDTVRRLDSVSVVETPVATGRMVDLVFEGPGFLYNQVRIMAALILEAGKGHIEPADIHAILAAGDRRRVPGALPAAGLCLVEVRYGPIPDPARRPAPRYRGPTWA